MSSPERQSETIGEKHYASFIAQKVECSVIET